MTKKKRISIPDDIAADVMHAADRTCCVCNKRGLPFQIHHIDEDPSNNARENLAVLCLLCHDETMVSGGFGRKLKFEVVVRYRDDWNNRVAKRRAEADRQAIEQAPLSLQRAQQSNEALYDDERANAILEYVKSLPSLRQHLVARAQPEWDSGVTARMVEASYGYIDALQGILVTMAAFFPKGHFGDDDPHRCFSEIVSSRFAWHRSIAEPDGPGTGGTIIHVTTSDGVTTDVEKMVEDMAMSLVGYDDRFDWRGWPSLWSQ